MLNQRIAFYGLKGTYGGDAYEDWILEKLRERVNLYTCRRSRCGGLRTIINMFPLLFKSMFSNNGTVLRPLGLPIYKSGMIVIIHHYDLTGLKWYARLVESWDFIILRIFKRFFQVNILVVSQYWKDWALQQGFSHIYLVYNDIEVDKTRLKSRREISSKYNLNPDKQWVFLGSSESKKGGSVIAQSYEGLDCIFICSGKPSSKIPHNLNVVWFDNDDYLSFLASCTLVVANSKFKEGWCRVLHEAAILNVPVCGSGAGGMRELLSFLYPNNSHSQSIEYCLSNIKYLTKPDFKKLSDHVKRNNSDQIDKLVRSLHASC